MALNEDDLSTYSMRDFRANLAHIMGEVSHGHKRVKLTTNGRDAAFVISPEEMAYFEALEDEADRQAIAAYQAKGTAQKLYTADDVRRELDR